MRFLALVSMLVSLLFAGSAFAGDKFIAALGDLDEVGSPGPWKMLVIGKPLADETAYEGIDNGCGKYESDEFGGFSDSTTFDGTLYGRYVLLWGSDWKNDKIWPIYFANAPAKGTKYTTITKYDESGSGYDDSVCVQENGGISITKYDSVAG